MSHHRLWTVFAWLVCASPLAADAQNVQDAPAPRPQPPAAEVVPAASARHLERWLGWMSRARHGSRVNRGVWKLVAGGAFGASTAAAIVETAVRDESFRPQGVTWTAGLAVALLADGIITLNVESLEEDRYRRWSSLTVRDSAAIAHFEGELAASAAEARRSETFRGALWIGLGACGATLLAITPFGDYADGDERFRYAGGAIMLALGTWQAIASFTGETWQERAYRMYQERRPLRAARRLSLVPSLSARGGGLTLSGTF